MQDITSETSKCLKKCTDSESTMIILTEKIGQFHASNFLQKGNTMLS